MIKKSVIELIGNTPLLELSRAYPAPGRILAKAEFLQPGGSIKDRAALQIIKDAYKNGKLIRGQSVVEMTSGNMGAGLAIVCNVTGNPFIAVMSEGNSPARAKMLTSLGAEVHLIPQIDGSPGEVTGQDIRAATEKAIELANEIDAFYVDQFNNYSSITAHFWGTGLEIWSEAGFTINAFVAAIGSGGTFIGISKYLKQKNGNIICAAVEPEGAEVLAGKDVTTLRHNMQGIGYGVVVPLWDASLADVYLTVNSKEASYYQQVLAEKEGLYVGYSAAANVCASIKLIESGIIGKNPTVVTILCDTGLKY